MALIELKAAQVVLEGHPIFQSLDFALQSGQSMSVTGANGAGKTTFLRLLGGDLWPVDAESRCYGFGDKPTWSPLRAREQIAFVSPLAQERVVRLAQDGADGERGARLSARKCVSTGLFDSFLLHQKPTTEQQKQVERALARFSLNELAGRELQTLSQGQLRRVLLARALVKHPRVVLLDEAASGLDTGARDELFIALHSLSQSGVTFVFASHRAEELPAWTTRWTIGNGRIERESSGGTEARLQAPSSPVRSAASVIPRGHAEESNNADLPFSNEEPQVDSPACLLGMTKATGATSNRSPAVTKGGDERALVFELQNVSVFLDGTPILRDLNWVWTRGAHWQIAGENGSGKTTFLRLLGGELSPALGGEIKRLGQTNRPVWEWRRRIALVSPLLQARFHEALSVREAIASGWEGGFVAPRELSTDQQNAVEWALDEWDLRHLQRRRFDRLSYGQTRRVLLARALVASPEVVLLDEALDGLDAATRDFCFQKWQQLARNGTHFAFASHHAADFPGWVNGEIRLESGRMGAVSPG